MEPITENTRLDRLMQWLARAVLLAWLLLSAAACSTIDVRQVQRAGQDDALDAAASGSLRSIGLDADQCQREPQPCLARLERDDTLAIEDRWLAMAELQWSAAIAAGRASISMHAPLSAIDRYLEVARLGYAAMLLDATSSLARRETRDRMRQLYNRASERVALALFEQPVAVAPGDRQLELPHWRLHAGEMDVRLPQGQPHPRELLPVSQLRLAGLRNDYRRDGVGTAFVAVGIDADATAGGLHEPAYVAATVIVRFPGNTPDEVLQADSAFVDVCDPYRDERVRVGDRALPLAAGFSAPYAAWLARSKFGREGERVLLRPGDRPTRPRIYPLQPYDPDRRIVVLLHGLGSSPEAWLNLANDVLGDATLRRHYQLWQVFYPTNLPIAENRKNIRESLLDAMAALDPDGTALASRHMVLVGHSMGGVISRLLVVDSADALWRELLGGPVDGPQQQRLALLAPYLTLEPLPPVDRVILLASPHRGAPMAGGWLGRAASHLVRLPITAVQTVHAVADAIQGDAPGQAEALRARQMDSVEALSDQGRYLQVTSSLTIARTVTYHSIIGRKDPATALADSSDGVVPYSSSHLDGAASERIVTSGHGVQETPEAIAEIRRILLEAVAPTDDAAADKPSPHGPPSRVVLL